VYLYYNDGARVKRVNSTIEYYSRDTIPRTQLVDLHKTDKHRGNM